MRKHIHTALVIFALVVMPAIAGLSPDWTNGNMFASAVFSADGYSGCVERVASVGDTMYEAGIGEIFFGWITKNNRYKLVAVKENLRKVRPYVIKTELSDLAVISALNTNGSIVYASDVEWCQSLGLPTNYLGDGVTDLWEDYDATPFFNLQSQKTSNGWHGVFRLLTNSVWLTGPFSRQRAINTEYWGYGSSTQSIADAYAANAWQTNTPTIDGYYYYGSSADNGGGRTNYFVDVTYGGVWTNYFTSPYEGASYAVAYYVKSVKGGSYVAPIHQPPHVFNPLYSSLSTNYTVYATNADSYKTGIVATVVQKFPTFDVIDAATNISCIVYSLGQHKVMKFDQSTNGFKYR